MKWKKSDGFILGILSASLILFFILYPSLPEEVPLHWNFKMEVDRWGSPRSLIPLALLGPGLWIFYRCLPLIDPRKDSYEKHEKSYRTIMGVTILFLQIFFWIVIATSLGIPFDMNRAILLAMGTLMLVTGNFASKIRHNYFLGIRTPWTLASEENWRRTHRMGAKSIALSGLSVILLGIFFPHVVGGILLIAVGFFVPILYSLWYFLRHERKPS